MQMYFYYLKKIQDYHYRLSYTGCRIVFHMLFRRPHHLAVFYAVSYNIFIFCRRNTTKFSYYNSIVNYPDIKISLNISIVC